MNKKLLFFCLTAFSSFFINAQTSQQPLNFCGTAAPSQQYDAWLNGQVEEYKKNMAGNKDQRVVHTIPVIVHIIYFNEAIGTYPNLDSNQVKSQIAALNKDFSGNGVNVNNVPSAFAGLVANTGIQFCLATKDRQDQPQIPHGIERISASANSWLSPNTATLDLKSYFNNVIIPATIWDPTKYLNIWVSDKPANYPLTGFATYPPSSGLTGVFGGNIGIGTINNDGIWIYARNLGTGPTGALAPFDEGRTATHEIGHWLGLRHIWGDGNCLSDYCGDTPTQKQAHTGCVTTTPADQCGVGTSPNGEMPMNFMDMTDDACRYMFTNDQNVRMQTALSQSPLRYQLGTHNKCAGGPALPTSSAVASFNTNFTQCLNRAFTPFNTSSGYPNPTFVWSSSPAGVFSPNNAVANPAITLNNPGTYTLTLVATNSLSSSTATFVVSAQNTCAAVPACLDSIRMISATDTLTKYRAPNSTISGCGAGLPTGYLVGTNCYKDKEFAQFFPPTRYTGITMPQVNSVIVLFDTLGTKSPNSAAQVICKIYGGSGPNGPGSVQGSVGASMSSIMSTPAVTDVTYLGKAGQAPKTGNKMYAYRFDFATPIIISSPTTGFFAGIQIPNNPGDSVSIMTNTKYNSAIDSSAWFFSANLSWRPFKSNRSTKVQMAIIPIMTCGPVGLKEEGLNLFNSNINIMPNPSNGVFNFLFTLPTEQSLSINVYNSLGQLVVSNQLKNVMNNIHNVDLSEQPDGIYFSEISNGKEKVVRKIVLSH